MFLYYFAPALNNFIHNINKEYNPKSGKGNGFIMNHHTKEEFGAAMKRALKLY